MAIKDKELQSDALNLDKNCPIQQLLKKNKERISKIKKRQGIEEDTNTKEEKKEETPIKKLYPIYQKVALSVCLVMVLGYLIASLFVPDVGAVIMAIIDSLDLFKEFRDGRALNPSDFVMFK